MSEWWLLGGFISLFIVGSMITLFPFYKSRLSLFILSPVVLLSVVMMYWLWGGFQGWIGYIHADRQQQKVQAMLKKLNDPMDVVDMLKARLKQQPDSARGWYLLGRVYASLNQWPKAQEAYAKAHRLTPDDLQITINDALSLWELNHKTCNDEIRRLFQSVLQQDANQPDALAMLAMDAFLGHAYKPAIDYWQRLLNTVPPQSEEAKAIRRAIAKAARHQLKQ